MIRTGLAPTDRAASITPGCTVSRFCSTMRLIANDAPSDSVKMIAGCPMPLPVTRRARGCAATRKITNGIGRKVLTTRLRTANTARFGSRLLARVR
ncbi:hypothetical protein MAFF212519_20250 [Clavibacter michiganensis]